MQDARGTSTEQIDVGLAFATTFEHPMLNAAKVHSTHQCYGSRVAIKLVTRQTANGA